MSLGSLNPDLYKDIDNDEDGLDIPVDHLGSVWFAVDYERDTERLTITLIKARNLRNRSPFGGISCDPFVRSVTSSFTSTRCSWSIIR